MGDRGYQEIRINHAEVMTDKVYHIAGIQLVYWSGPTLTVKVDNQDSPGFLINPGDVLNIDFTRLFFSQALTSIDQGYQVAESILIAVADPKYRFFKSFVRNEIQHNRSPANLTLEENEFLGYGDQAAVPAEYGAVQLFNPADSGIQIQVRTLYFTQGTGSGQALFGYYNTALANNKAATYKANKINGESAPIAQIRTESNASGSGLLSNWFKSVKYNSAYTEPVHFKPNIILNENSGLVVAHQAVNVAFYVSFEWKEVLI